MLEVQFYTGLVGAVGILVLHIKGDDIEQQGAF